MGVVYVYLFSRKGDPMRSKTDTFTTQPPLILYMSNCFVSMNNHNIFFQLYNSVNKNIINFVKKILLFYSNFSLNLAFVFVHFFSYHEASSIENA